MRNDPLSSPDHPQFEAQPPEGHPSLSVQPPLLPAPPDLAPRSNIPTGRSPIENPVWSGWDVLLLTVLAVLSLFVFGFFTLIVAWLTVYRGSSFGEVAEKPVLALVGEFLSYIAIAVYMVMLVEGKYRTPFGRAMRWNWPSTNLKTLVFVGIGVLTIVLDILGNLFLPIPKSSPFDQFFQHPVDAYLMAAFAVIFGPLMEELFFRGFLYPVLARWLGAVAAVVLTALPFGFIHYFQYKSWSAVLVITLVGIVLTTVRAVTKSVSASYLVHVGYNGTLMLLAAAATHGFRHMENAAAIHCAWPSHLGLPSFPF